MRSGGTPSLAAGGVVAVDEIRERVERYVLRERHSERHGPLSEREPPPRLVEGEPEDRAVRHMDRKAGGPPEPPARHCLPEQRDVRVVTAEQAAVEGLEQPPDGRADSARCCRVQRYPIARRTPSRSSAPSTSLVFVAR